MITTATKTSRTLQSSTANAAAATTTGATINLSTSLGMVVTAKITNGATGPTVGCDFVLQISRNGTGSCSCET